MKPGDIKHKLIDVIQNIQSISGHGSIPLNGSICPTNDLEGFDSLIWPVATGMLAGSLGVDIPLDKNIFLAKDGKRHLTIDEIVTVVRECTYNKENPHDA